MSKQRWFRWSWRWQLLTAMLAVLLVTLLLFSWVGENLFLTSLDHQLNQRLGLLTRLAQSELPLARMQSYLPGDEQTAIYRQDAELLTMFARQNQLDQLSVLSPEGDVRLDTRGAVLGSPSGWNPTAAAMTQRSVLHRDPQGHWQKSRLYPLPGANWLLLAAGSHITALINEFHRRQFYILLVGVSMAMGLAWLMSFFLSRRVSHLSQAFQALQTGKPGVLAQLSGSDELAFLSQAFNVMARELESKTQREKIASEKRIEELKILSAGVAHEIRNPLAALSGLADLLARQASGIAAAEIADLTDRMQQEISRLNQIIQEVMSYARQPQLTLTRIDLAELSLFLRQLDPACRIDFPASDFPICADPAGLRTILRNLVINAREAAGASGWVAVSLAKTDAGVEFQVCDSGAGISADEHDRIFQPFFSRKPSGTGLGLAIARNIAEAHHGRLALNPAAPAGACFKLYLPFSPVEDNHGKNIDR